MLLHEEEREDLEREHDCGLDQVVRERVPDRDNAGVQYVHASVPQDARHVPRDLNALEDERGALERHVGLFVDPYEQLVQDEEKQQHDDVNVQRGR